MSSIPPPASSIPSSSSSLNNNFKTNDLVSLLPPLRSLTSISSSDLILTSTLTSNSSNPSNPSSTIEEFFDFYIILPDSDFNEKIGGIMKKSMIKSESLKGKFQRKLGSVDVLSYSDALTENWLRKLYPGKY